MESERVSNQRICFLLRIRAGGNWVESAAADRIEEQEATIARLHDLVAKFQSGGTSTLYAEGHME